MSIFILLLKSVFAFFVLYLICINVIGFFAGGLFQSARVKSAVDQANAAGADPLMRSIIEEEAGRARSAGSFSTCVSGIVLIGLLFLINNIWGNLLLISAVLMMVNRMIDLSHESQTGQRSVEGIRILLFDIPAFVLVCMALSRTEIHGYGIWIAVCGFVAGLAILGFTGKRD
jgi:hypothetical protein